MFNSLKNEFGDLKNEFGDLKEKVKSISIDAMKEFDKVTSFVNYDRGLPFTDSDYGKDPENPSKHHDRDSDYSYEKRCKACNAFESGILDQGMFQVYQFDKARYEQMFEFLNEQKDNIAKINFFYVSESLIDSMLVTQICPLVNVYHTAIGMTFVDKKGRIIRSALLQLEFGAFDSTVDVAERFFVPHFCMNMIKDKDGKTTKPPTDFTPKEFIENLFIDYSHSCSSLMFSFLETDNYLTEQLVEDMKCVSLADNPGMPAVPFGTFLNQNMTFQQLYDAYEKDFHLPNGKFTEYNVGPDGKFADGRVFCLSGFGPNAFTSQGGMILNFATCTSVDSFKTFCDWAYTNYGGCSQDLFNNNLQYYSLFGCNKLTPVDSLSNFEAEELMSKDNIISTQNGFISEMVGRTTHCNTVCAVVITLI